MSGINLLMQNLNKMRFSGKLKYFKWDKITFRDTLKLTDYEKGNNKIFMQPYLDDIKRIDTRNSIILYTETSDESIEGYIIRNTQANKANLLNLRSDILLATFF